VTVLEEDLGPIHTGTSTHGATLVGIPTRNEAATVAAVAASADAGLAAFSPGGANVVALADNGSTDGTVERFLAADVRAHKIVVRSPGQGTGKGTNVLALVDKALEIGASRLTLLDGDVRSAEPAWIGLLSAAVDLPEPVMALPVYRRNRYEANSTNHLVRPLLAAAFGSHPTQPIGGEFAFNRAFLERVRTWPRPDSAQLYGIDVWLTANALREGLRIVDVPLGRKVHNSPFPKILFLPLQVLDSLFHVVSRLDGTHPASPTEHVDHQPAIDTAATRQDPVLVARISRCVERYLAEHLDDVRELFPAARDLRRAPWGLRVSAEAWPQILADALQGLAAGEFDRSRDHVIALMVNRVMTFWEDIEGLDGPGIDAIVDRQAADTEAAVRERIIRFDRPPAPLTFDPGRWSRFQLGSEEAPRL
jgi:glucosylglycerate synthase